ncbi:stage II sporulation protein P [[Clostridium] fimetarium]|uniref:Stage II sporulation protein P n=1 Tax=[Clostridium] fimetarium TaxID=99656 RepID=A0A1I0QXX5_9FIRM|nr:stage II sporulation protein P [[Clostridium] fimetarium]SEW32691.1 stage II sporulation protein P [[Clostridium] fimetarium]
MKRYKYRMRQMGININKMVRALIILIIAILFIMFLLNRCNNKDISDKVISLIGEKIYASEMPINSYMDELDSYTPENWINKFVCFIYPINNYIGTSDSAVYVGDFNETTSPNSSNPNPENASSANNETTADETNTTAANVDTNGGTQAATTTTTTQTASPTEISAKVAEAFSNNIITGSVYPKLSLENFNFLYSNFYTVTSITTLKDSMLRPKEFLAKDMTVTHDASTPQILIFHTHSQETFTDSVEGDPSTSIVGVGEYLTQILKQKYGLNVIHDSSVYDYVNGVLDRSKAYDYSEAGIKKILEENPSIEVVIDLHRDGVPDTTHLVTDVNGKQTAKIMFFNGLSYSNINGNISYLNNPYRDDNLAMSLQMQLLGNAYYPGYLRRIYVNAYRYCLHLRGKSMLIEAGAQTNSVEEEMNAMEPLADVLNKLLSGQKAYQ